jgi:HK97 family phage prohead protease
MCRRCRIRRLVSLRLGLVWIGCTDEEEPMTTMSLARFEGDGIQVRRAEVTTVDEEGTVEARIVPYEHEVQLDEGLFEVFSRGAFASAVGNPTRCKVTDQGHQRQVVIGHAVELRDDDDAHYGRLRIADTSQGRDVLALFRAGSLTELSVEFRPQKRHMKISQRPGGVLVRHDRATLVGVSPVGAGAYGDEARVLAVREATVDRQVERILAQLQGLTAGPVRA